MNLVPSWQRNQSWINDCIEYEGLRVHCCSLECTARYNLRGGHRGHPHFLASQHLNFGHWAHTSAFFNDVWSKTIFSRNFEAIEIHKFWGPEVTFAEPRKYLIVRCTLTASFSYHDALLQQAIYSTMTHALLQKSICSTMTHALLQESIYSTMTHALLQLYS